MLACNIYVDNQEVISYPVSYIMRNLNFVDQFMVYGGDDISYNILKDTLGNTPKVQIINIDNKIKDPQDIAAAQNKCLEYTFNLLKPDFILSLQADILFSIEGIRQIHEYISNPTTSSLCFKIQHVKLYIKCGISHYGAVLLNRDCKERFEQDGAYLSADPHKNENYKYHDNIACLDIGYLSPQIWAKKLRQHAKTWGSPSALADAIKYDDKNKLDFILKYSKYVKKSVGCFGLLNKEIDAEWYTVIEDLGLVEDWKATVDILKEDFCK